MIVVSKLGGPGVDLSNGAQVAAGLVLSNGRREVTVAIAARDAEKVMRLFLDGAAPGVDHTPPPQPAAAPAQPAPPVRPGSNGAPEGPVEAAVDPAVLFKSDGLLPDPEPSGGSE